jgi:hypothetical protein
MLERGVLDEGGTTAVLVMSTLAELAPKMCPLFSSLCSALRFHDKWTLAGPCWAPVCWTWATFFSSSPLLSRIGSVVIYTIDETFFFSPPYSLFFVERDFFSFLFLSFFFPFFILFDFILLPPFNS